MPCCTTKDTQTSFPQTTAVYADDKDVFGLLMGAMQELLGTRPVEPIPALVRYFFRQSRQIIRIAVCGPPNSGREAFARKIAVTYDLPLIEPENLLEKADPQLAAFVRAYRKRGHHLPPGLAFTLLRQEIFSQDFTEKGWVLCGFPETRAQDVLFRRRGICTQKTIILTVTPEVASARCSESNYDPVTKRLYNIAEELPADETILQRLIKPSCQVVSVTAEMARNFAYESTVLAKSLATLSREDPCCITLNGDGDMEGITREEFYVFKAALHFVSIRPIQHRPYMHRVLFVGRTGSGKKAQAEMLAKQLRLCHVSSGNLVMRAATDPENEHFREVNMFFSRNRAVPDDIVAGMVLDDLKVSELQGYVLRGFPRSISQAILLAQFGFQPSKVFFLDLPEEFAVERLMTRGRELYEKAQPLAERYVVTESSQRPSRFKSQFPPGFQNEPAQLAAIQEQNRIFADNEFNLREFYKDISYDIDASQPAEDMFNQIRYHLLHPRPFRPVQPPVSLEDEEPVASFISEQIEVEQW